MQGKKKKKKTVLGIASSLVRKDVLRSPVGHKVFSSMVSLSNETLNQSRVMYNLKTS